MKKLRSRFERFCYRHRNWGIPNLMLFIALGSAMVYLFSMVSENAVLYEYLRFDLNLILKGQVWRLVSYALTLDNGSIIFTLVSLVCYYSLGRAMENAWGTLRFNLFYFTGVLMMDVYALMIGLVMPEWVPILNQWVSVNYLNLSLFLGYATLYPDAQFLLLFIIPVRAWIFALVDLVLTAWGVIQMLMIGAPVPIALFPLIALANYFLFFGKDVANVIPVSWRLNARRLFRKKPKKSASKGAGPIPFPSAGSYQASTAKAKAPYNHCCTVCGRTDVSNPELEFRYCSRCSGYHCYCEDHIGNHEHIQ